MIRLFIFTASFLMMSLSQASSIEDLLECRQVDSDAQRLLCFDQTSEELCKSEPCKNRTESDEMTKESSSTENKSQETLFGITKKPVDEKIDRIVSTIKEIKLAAYGKHVFVLENGQVWMENEPGKKKVRNNQQKVVIRKKRLRYLISFESGVSLAVHRIE